MAAASKHRDNVMVAATKHALLGTLAMAAVNSLTVVGCASTSWRVFGKAALAMLLLLAKEALRWRTNSHRRALDSFCFREKLVSVVRQGPWRSRSKRLIDAPKPTPRAASELQQAIRACFVELRRCRHGQRGSSFSMAIETPSRSRCSCKVFEPSQFAFLRSQWGVAEEDFWSSLCDSELTGGTTQASGKSGSIFWFTDDRRFVLKSLNPSEVQALVDILGAYMQHFRTNPASMLCRFFGAFEVLFEGQTTQFVVMNNVLRSAPGDEPHAVYDLKGTTEDRWVDPQLGVVLKDLNFANKMIGIADPRQRDELQETLRQDARFLRQCNIMDYSICLGVHYCADDAHPSREASSVSSKLAVLSGFEPKFQCTMMRDQPAQRVVYYIGVIDILQRFDLSKVVAHIAKSCSLGLIHEIDTVPPAHYARRFKAMVAAQVQTYREPTDRTGRLVQRLQACIHSGAIQPPTLAPSDAPRALTIGLARAAGEDVTVDEAVDFAVRYGGRLQLLRRAMISGWRSRYEDVEACLDVDRHALVFQPISKGLFEKKRSTFAVACYNIRRVYISVARSWQTDRAESEPVESRRFVVEADRVSLRFTAPSVRQAKLWVTALEVVAGYAQASVEPSAATPPPLRLARADSCPFWVATMSVSSNTRAALVGSLDGWLAPRELASALAIARPARVGMLEPYLLGPAAERLWERRCVKWMFSFVEGKRGAGLSADSVKALWRDLNIDSHEGARALARFLKSSRTERRGERIIRLPDFQRMLQDIEALHTEAVYASVARTGHFDEEGGEGRISSERLAAFLGDVQKISPRPTAAQVERLLGLLDAPLVAPGLVLTHEGLAQLLCSPGNSLIDPAARTVFQDMTQPLSSYLIETSHNTYLEGNQLSSRSSVLRYVEVLRAGCRSVEVDVWDGANGEPIVKHGYTMTTEALFHDVIAAIADHAFVASEYPVIVSIEQHCSAPQLAKQGEILMQVLGDRLFTPPWDEEERSIDWDRMATVSPWSARGRILIKSSTSGSAGVSMYDRCVALPTKKLSQGEKRALRCDGREESEDTASDSQPRHACQVNSMSASKLLKLREAAGEESLRAWNADHLTRTYPEGRMITSSNVDPLPLWACGVQMVALNYQTPDRAMLLSEGLFRSYNGGCGYVLKSPMLLGRGEPRRRRRLRVRVCCGHRLPRTEASQEDEPEAIERPDADASSPVVEVGLEPGGQRSQSRPAARDGFHPVFNHDADFDVAGAPLQILTFEVRDTAPGARPIARRSVALDAVREGFRWLPLRSTSGHTLPHSGLLVHVEFSDR